MCQHTTCGLMCWAGGCMALGKRGLARQRSSWRRPSTSIGLRRCAMLQRGKPSSLGARTSPGVGRRPCRLACATFMARRPPLRQPHRCPRRGPRCIRTARRRRGRRFLRRRRRRRRGGAADVREPSVLCAVGASVGGARRKCVGRGSFHAPRVLTILFLESGLCRGPNRQPAPRRQVGVVFSCSSPGL